jgi:hypothetical protein
MSTEYEKGGGNMIEELLLWFIYGRVGKSSKTMAAVALDLPGTYKRSWPADVDDLNRCLLLLARVPGVRGAFPKLAQLSPEWAALIERWDELEERFLAEVGLDWCRGTNAPDTYRLMRKILEVNPGQSDTSWYRPASKDLVARITPKPKPKPKPVPVPVPVPEPEPEPEPTKGKKSLPGRRRIKWTPEQVVKMINDEGYRLSDCARKIGVSTTCLILGLQRHGLKYLSKPVTVIKLNDEQMKRKQN